MKLLQPPKLLNGVPPCDKAPATFRPQKIRILKTTSVRCISTSKNIFRRKCDTFIYVQHSVVCSFIVLLVSFIIWRVPISCIYACVRNVCTYAHACVRICMRICVCVYVHICIHVHACSRVCACMHMWLWTLNLLLLRFMYKKHFVNFSPSYSRRSSVQVFGHVDLCFSPSPVTSNEAFMKKAVN